MSPRAVVLPSLVEAHRRAHRPHIYFVGGMWWVRCKHRNATGPYLYRSTAFDVARDIWIGA